MNEVLEKGGGLKLKWSTREVPEKKIKLKKKKIRKRDQIT